MVKRKTQPENRYRMKLFAAGCFLIAYYVHVLFANRNGCTLPVNGNEKKSPILLHANDTSSLIVPTYGNINLLARQTFRLLCPDPKNTLINFHVNITNAQCLHRNILRVENQDVKFEELQCRKTIRGSVQKTQRHCGANKGLSYRIGYQVTPKYFLSLIEVCYNEKVGAVLYTEHTLYGASIKYAAKSTDQATFSPAGLNGTISHLAYKKTYQSAAFTKLLGAATTDKYFPDNSSYLERGHLAPKADFLLAAWQQTTFYYLNAAPQWQAINGGNWKKVEAMVRRFADANKETLLVVTGTHEVLQVNGVDIYLQFKVDKLPVPKYFYKIVQSKASQRAVVLVGLNDPLGGGGLICEDICEKSGWKSKSWSDYERGFVHCCDYVEFARVVKTAPKLQVAGILQGTN